MICHTVRIPYSYGETIRVVPIFDIHYGNKGCDIKKLKYDLENDKDCYYYGGGDFFDSIVCTDKRYKKSSDATESNDIIDEQVDGLYQLLLDKKDKILCLGEGNHEEKVSTLNGTHPVKRLCKMLDVPFAGYSFYLRLMLHENGSRVRSVLIYNHHGFGSGRTLGADLSRYEKIMGYYSADIFSFGHSHQKHWASVERFDVNSHGKIISKPMHLCVAGTYLKTLTEDTNSTYAEKHGYRPVSLGGLTINIKPNRTLYDIWVDR